MIIYYSFCVLADDAISKLAKRPCIRIKSEDRHAAYCFKPGPSLYPEKFKMIVLLGLCKQGGGGICVDQHAVLFFTSCLKKVMGKAFV